MHSCGCRGGVSTGTNSLLQELDSRVDIVRVGEVGSSDGKGAATDAVTRVAEDPDLLTGEVGNLSAVLLVPGVAVHDSTVNAVLNFSGEAADSGVHDGSALTGNGQQLS